MPADRELFESQVPICERESTTFCQDFLIAERFGLAAIKDTYSRAFAEWKSSYKYLTELCMTLCHLIVFHLQRDPKNEDRTNLYSDLWQKTFDWGLANLKGDELKFFLAVLD